MSTKELTISHVGDQILDNIHVRQWINLGHISTRLLFPLGLNVTKASQGVTSVDVHGARSADSLTARSAEGQSGILLGFDFDESIQDHGSAVVEINGVRGEVLISSVLEKEKNMSLIIQYS